MDVSTSKKSSQGVSPEALDYYQKQCEAIAHDWARLRNMIDGFSQPGADKEKLEWELIALKSRLACDYPVLTEWRKGGYGLSAGVNKMLTGATNLATLADSGGNPESRVNRNWRDVQTALVRVQETLQKVKQTLSAGKPAFLPDKLIEQTTHRPFPIKKILKIVAATCGILLLAGTFYIMRNFLGFWAPGAGDGIVVDESMSDEDKIRSVLVIMNEAFKQDDVDMFMTVIAKDFEDDEGNGRRALRVGLQAYHEKGLFKSVTVDWSRMSLLDKDGFIYARPIIIHAEGDELSIYLGFKPYRGKLLIASASAT